jgi:hypothetical protein
MESARAARDQYALDEAMAECGRRSQNVVCLLGSVRKRSIAAAPVPSEIVLESHVMAGRPRVLERRALSDPRSPPAAPMRCG